MNKFSEQLVTKPLLKGLKFSLKIISRWIDGIQSFSKDLVTYLFCLFVGLSTFSKLWNGLGESWVFTWANLVLSDEADMVIWYGIHWVKCIGNWYYVIVDGKQWLSLKMDGEANMKYDIQPRSFLHKENAFGQKSFF